MRSYQTNMNKKLHNLYNNECKITIKLSAKPIKHIKENLISFWGTYKDTERYKIIVSPTNDDAYMIALHLLDKDDYVDVIGKIKLIKPKDNSDVPIHNMMSAHRIIYRTPEFKLLLAQEQPDIL